MLADARNVASTTIINYWMAKDLAQFVTTVAAYEYSQHSACNVDVQIGIEKIVFDEITCCGLMFISHSKNLFRGIPLVPHFRRQNAWNLDQEASQAWI